MRGTETKDREDRDEVRESEGEDQIKNWEKCKENKGKMEDGCKKFVDERDMGTFAGGESGTCA